MDSPLSQQGTTDRVGFFATYRPLIVIIGLIALATIVAATRHATWQGEAMMMDFMAGFFLVFSGLKLLDVGGFARAYATYDLLAGRVRGYGYLYPFLEAALGLAYLGRIAPDITNLITVGLMTFSGVGVLRSLAQKKHIRCACLGTAIQVPLTTLTLVEDFGMAVMAGVMLWL